MKRPPDNVPAAGLLYAETFNWCVFPVPPGTRKSYKSAKFSNGKRWGATNKASVIERDFRRWPRANLGIPTGAENGVWVLDADTLKGHGVDGIAELRKLERKHGRLPRTLMAESPSGSLHYYFEWPKRGLIICNSTSAIAPGVDVRGEGGMVLASPSIKKGVGKYRWINWGTPIARAPKWLLKLVVHRPACSTNDGSGNGACGDVGLIKAGRELSGLVRDRLRAALRTGRCRLRAVRYLVGDVGQIRCEAVRRQVARVRQDLHLQARHHHPLRQPGSTGLARRL
jgi:hypothetical protein